MFFLEVFGLGLARLKLIFSKISGTNDYLAQTSLAPFVPLHTIMALPPSKSRCLPCPDKDLGNTVSQQTSPHQVRFSTCYRKRRRGEMSMSSSQTLVLAVHMSVAVDYRSSLAASSRTYGGNKERVPTN